MTSRQSDITSVISFLLHGFIALQRRVLCDNKIYDIF